MIQPLLRWRRRSSATTEGRLRAALQFPLPEPERIALLDDGFIQGRNTRVFAADDLHGIHLWAPEAIIAPLGTALSLADQKQRGLAALTSLRLALVVLTDLGGEALTEDYRELLWHAFGVPIFEQLRGENGNVIARECEVHNGMHLDPAAALTQEISSGLIHPESIHEACECGAEAPRIRCLQVLQTIS